MLKKILSISGRPGLYQLVSYGKNMLLVETIPAGRRFPIHSRERVMSLGDISIFTTSEDVPLSQVLENALKKFDGKVVDAKAYTTPDQLHEFMGGVLENWDNERVHNSDIKKIIAWYNILVDAGMTDFTAKEEEEGKSEETTEETKE
ncbi:MAG: DUF5606 domain-containing protein [Muribaculaceae bacterium]|nr:DUF5606 domain-containing protein [Muribaculaceae bacterium]